MDALLAGVGDEQRPFTRHFNQSEEFFLKLEGEYTIPQFSIHHDVRLPRPSSLYLASLLKVTEQVTRLAPQVLKGLSYFFDPAEILRPGFYRLSTFEGRPYLSLVRIDLVMRPSESVVTVRGTNDITPQYRSNRLFLESTVIPLAEVAQESGQVQTFRVRQTISQTWIGEQGRGYFVQGIWMDADLTKFFSRLLLPPGRTTYPYYPYQCKYKTVCHSSIRFSPQARSESVPALHRSLTLLVPVMDRIEEKMKGARFSEQMEVFQELKRMVPPAWYEEWDTFRVESYLNESEKKEFRIED
jgi:hypothetical protein